MDVFSTLDSKQAHNLSQEEYTNATHRTSPYVIIKRGKLLCFAICPECGNPIQIINLHGEEYEEVKTKIRRTHARHYIHTIEGLANYDKDRYLSCPLHNSKSFSCKELRQDEVYNNELLHLILKNEMQIMKNIREITGINFSSNYLKTDVIQPYIKTNHFSYKHTTKYNIPYSILCTSKALDIFGRYLKKDSPYVDEIERIINNTTNFCIETDSNQEKKVIKKCSDYIRLQILFSNHSISKNTIKLSLLEFTGNNGAKSKCLGSLQMNMKSFFYN